MKKKILLTAFTIIFLISNAHALNVTCNSTQDSEVYLNNPNANYGSDETNTIRNHETHSRRIYYFYDCNLEYYLNYYIPVSAQTCYYVTGDGTTQMISAHHVTNDSWEENTITWNNQPCGTDFDDSANCNLTRFDIINSTGINTTICFNSLQPITEETNDYLSIALKTYENDSMTSDAYASNNNTNTTIRPYTTITLIPKTNMTITFSEYFSIDEYNLVQVNYTQYLTSEPVINATCHFNSTTGNATMTYNESESAYEIFVIPESSDYGIVTFTVNCSKNDYESQYESQEYHASVFSGNSYNFSVYLWENKNATTPYIDEFGNIILKTTDYNCTLISGDESCWLIAQYTNGHADFNDTIPSGNFTMYFYSGYLTQSRDYYPPEYSSFNDFLAIGINSFVITNETERIDLWVNPLELDFWTGIKTWFLTTGFALTLLVVSFVVAVVVGIIVFNVGGRNATITIITVVSTLIFTIFLFEQIFNINIGLNTIINLILP